MAQRDHAGFTDLVQPAGAFGVGGGGGRQRGDGERGKSFHLIPLAPEHRRLHMIPISGTAPAGNRLVPR